MFHYRWYFDEDADNASTILPLTDLAVNMPNEILKDAKKYVHDRQTGRLWVVGSNETTADLIDASFKRFLKLMDDHLSISKFLFGEKPSSADFAIYGQLTQLIGFEPTSRKIAYDNSLRLVSWQDVMADLSGHDVENSSWTPLEESPASLKEIMKEFGLIRKGFLCPQRPINFCFPCLKWIKEEFEALSENDQLRVKTFLNGTGCEILLG